MLGLLDAIHLRRRIKLLDDQSVAFRRKYGTSQSRVILFLPWGISIERAEFLRLLPASYFSCYETPQGIVSSTPRIPVDSLTGLEKAFQDDLGTIRNAGRKPLLIGMSMGNFPATYLANKHGLDLISIASGHSGDWLTFNSPAASHIRSKAESAGLSQSDFTGLIAPLSPVNHLAHLGSGSQFIFGTYDHYIPKQSREILIARLGKERPDIPITKVPLGHLATIVLWKFLVRAYEDS
jgi:hypothetical protein